MNLMRKSLFLIFLLLPLYLQAAETFNFVGYIKCYSPEGRETAEYTLLKKGKGKLSSGTLAEIYNSMEKYFTLTQTKAGKCYKNGTLEIFIEKPIYSFVLLKALSDIYNLQYVFDGNINYNPTYIIFYKKGISFESLLEFLRDNIKKQNPKVLVEYVPDQNLLLISRKIINIKTVKKPTTTCTPMSIESYADICKNGICQRYALTVAGMEVKLEPYYTCKGPKKVYYKYKNLCKNGAEIANLYLNKINIVQLFRVFEKFFKINFIYDETDISKLKGANNLHLAFKCLNRERAIDFLKRDFHLYVEHISSNVIRLITDKDAYSIVLQRTANYGSKIFYLKNITVTDFVKLLELYYGKEVLYSADPTFNAVTVIGPTDKLEDIAQKFKVYIRNSNEFDSLMTKVFYVKFGDVDKVVGKVKEYLSSKGSVKVLSDARALEITDYPTNIAMIEKVFGKFLSQKPVKIKITVKFVRINESFARSLGFNWSFTYTGTGKTESVLSWTANADNQGLTSAIQFAYRKLNPLNLQISAAESVSLAKTLSSPSLILLNGQAGSISSGVQIPYQSVDENGNPKTELVSASLSLNVQPELLPDGRILLKLQLSKNSPNTALAVNGQPAINTFTITQNFIVANGETLVIGGVLERTNNSGEAGTPLLKDIPLLGWLFKTKNWDRQDDELMVFITAKVVSE